MILPEDILKEITGLAEAFTKPSDIARIIEMPEEEFLEELRKPDSPFMKAFLRGKLISEAKLRKSVISIACQGSAPAQALAIKLRDELEMNLIKKKLV